MYDLPGTPKKPRRFKLKSWHLGLAVEQLGILTALIGYFWRDGETWHLVWFIVGSSLVGGLVWFFAYQRLQMLLYAVLAGCVIGLLSAWDLLLKPAFEQQFYVVAMTAAFFPGCGFFIGCVIELISFVHHLTHGRPPLAYLRGDDEPPEAVE